MLRAWLMFAYIFLIIASLLIIKPVRNSLFLTKFGVEQLPYVFIFVAVFATLIIQIYSRFSKKYKLNRIIVGTTLIAIASLIFFWILLILNYQHGWFYYAFYIWVSIFGVISTSQFWLLANHVFNAREARRIFGFLGAGAISGGIFGGYLTNYLAILVGTSNLLLICIAFLLICLLLLGIVWRQSTKQPTVRSAKTIQQPKQKQNIFQLILSSRHLLFLASIVGLQVLVANLLDFQFNAIASENINNADELTAFFGFWLSNLSIFSLVIQLVLTRVILTYWGVPTSLHFLPTGILICSILILLIPGLWVAVLIKVVDGSLKQSINKAGMELLALPIPQRYKNQVKTFIDVFVDSFATGISGILLIIFTHDLGLSVQHVSYIVITMLIIWFYLIYRIRTEYINSFALALKKRSIELDTQTVNLRDGAVVNNLVRVLEGNNTRQIYYTLQLLENVKNEKFIPSFKRLIHHPSGDIKLRVLKLIRQYPDDDLVFEASELLGDDNQEVQICAMQYIYQHSINKPLTIQKLLDDPNPRIQSAAMLFVAREFRENDQIKQYVDVVQLFKERFTLLRKAKNETQKTLIKLTAAKYIGTVQLPALHRYLYLLLKDPAVEIVRTAMVNAGKTRASRFLNFLVSQLASKVTRKTARQALANYGAPIVSLLIERLNQPDLNKNIRVEIPKVLALIGTQKTVDSLIKNLTQKDTQIRYEILKALNKLKTRNPTLDFKQYHKHIEKEILFETRQFYMILKILENHRKLNLPTQAQRSTRQILNYRKARNLLQKALEEKLDARLERIFRLLGLKYESRDIFNAYNGICSEKRDLRANAIEFLDNVLNATLKKIIIPIIETDSLDSLIKNDHQYIDVKLPGGVQCFEPLLHGTDNWIKMCTIFFLAQLSDHACLSELQALKTDPDPNVRATVNYALAKMETSKLN